METAIKNMCRAQVAEIYKHNFDESLVPPLTEEHPGWWAIYKKTNTGFYNSCNINMWIS